EFLPERLKMRITFRESDASECPYHPCARVCKGQIAITRSSKVSLMSLFPPNLFPFNYRLLKLCLVLLCGIPAKSPAATITVTTTADTGAGSLRAALASATNGDTINFSLTTPAKITLTNGQLFVSNSISILGPGPGNLRLDGNAASRVFYIRPSNTVTLSSLTVTNGAGGSGGGIF